MATSYQYGQPHLAQRILESAKDLAYSSFSDVAGIQAELRDSDPFGVGKSIASVPNSSTATLPIDFSKPTHTASISTTPGFRNIRGRHEHVEDEYHSFVSAATSLNTSDDTGHNRSKNNNARTISQSGWNDLWTYKDVASGASAKTRSLISPQLQRLEPVWERSSQGKVVYQEGRPEWKWRHEWKRISKDESREDSKTIHEMAPPDLKLATDDLDHHHHSTALTRLHQIQRHLAQPSPRTHELASWKQDWALHHERCDWTADRDDDATQGAHVAPDGPERYHFRCTRRTCHHRLLRQNENLSLEVRQRVCVHDDCGFVSDTVDAWLQHVTAPHHDATGQSAAEPAPPLRDLQGPCACARDSSSEIAH